MFRKTGEELTARGHKVTRVNLCPGDCLFWHGRGTRSFRGRLSTWKAYVSSLCKAEGVSDLVLLGPERPLHRDAIAVAQELGVEVFVVEMGYFRPDWITLERGGMGTRSHFPTDPALIAKLGRVLPAPDFQQSHRQTLWDEAVKDLVYNLSNLLLWFLYPHYRRFVLDPALREYAGWLRKALRAPARRHRTTRIVERLESNSFFLHPLQLETDYQIRSHSPFASQFDAIDLVLRSFAQAAPQDEKLVFKVHPLDNNLRDWERHCMREAARLGVGSRVHFLHGGDLDHLLLQCKGVVTINSTVGLRALLEGKPVKVLGAALFDVNGLTDSRSLADFFRTPRHPDLRLRDAFVALAAAAIHVRGTLYSRSGSSAGAKAIAQRLHEGSVNEPGAYQEPPPRLAKHAMEGYIPTGTTGPATNKP